MGSLYSQEQRDGIGIGGLELTDAPGDGCDTHYQIEVKNEAGAAFAVSGYGFPYLTANAQRQQSQLTLMSIHVVPVSLAGCPLTSNPGNRKAQKYTVTVKTP